VTEKTTSLFGGLGGRLASKLGDVKSSTAFKSFEERVGAVGSVVGSVKSKMTGSRSNSTNSFEEALNSMEQQRASETTEN